MDKGINIIPGKGIEINGQLVEIGTLVKDFKGIEGIEPTTIKDSYISYFIDGIGISFLISNEKIKSICIYVNFNFMDKSNNNDIIVFLKDVIEDFKIDYIGEYYDADTIHGIKLSKLENNKNYLCAYIEEIESLKEQVEFENRLIKYNDNTNTTKEDNEDKKVYESANTDNNKKIENNNLNPNGFENHLEKKEKSEKDWVYDDEEGTVKPLVEAKEEQEEYINPEQTQLYDDETIINTVEQLKEDFKNIKIEDFFERTKNRINNVIRYKYSGIVNESEIPVGSTKFGGLPDLPVNMSWPKDDITKESYSFLAQLSFKELKKFDSDNILPESGLLYIFVRQIPEDDEDERYSWLKESNSIIDNSEVIAKVIYVEEDSNLERKNTPNDIRHAEYDVHKCGKIEIVNYLEYPYFNTFSSDELDKIFSELGFDEEKQEFVKEFLEEYENLKIEESERFKTFGALENYQAGAEILNEQVLLLQFDSTDDLNFNFGDAGRIFFYISKEDLKNKRFDKIENYYICY